MKPAGFRPLPAAGVLLAVCLLGGGNEVAAPAGESGGEARPPSDLASPPADAKTTPSGLVFTVLSPGKRGGAHPNPTDLVTVHYSGWIASSGKQIDSSVQRGKPLTAALDYMLKGWREALPDMTVGEKRRLWIPEKLAFEGNPKAPKGTVVYDVELLDFRPGPSQPPPDVSPAPAGASRTPSGLAYRILRAGTGKRKPGPKSTVTVHYSGWSRDGNLVASSVARGKPVTFRVDTQMPGWQEALQAMVEGEARRIWVPARLAFLGKEGRPQTDLTYDLELLSIRDEPKP